MSVLCFITDESAIVDHQWGGYNDMPKTNHWSLSVHQGEREERTIQNPSNVISLLHTPHSTSRYIQSFEISSSDIQGMGCDGLLCLGQ